MKSLRFLMHHFPSFFVYLYFLLITQTIFRMLRPFVVFFFCFGLISAQYPVSVFERYLRKQGVPEELVNRSQLERVRLLSLFLIIFGFS